MAVHEKAALHEKASQPRYFVVVEWDDEADVYYVKETNIPGLNAEADSIDDMVEIIGDLAPTLLEANGCVTGDDGPDTPYTVSIPQFARHHHAPA